MTASPDTNNYDIYDLFDHHIAYEIWLQQALEEDLLCPFHYFGITDLEINGQVFDDSAGLRNFANLVCDARVNYILEKAEYTCMLSEDEAMVIEYMSKKLVSYKRVHELAILKLLISQNYRVVQTFRYLLKEQYGAIVPPLIEESAFRNLTNEFPKEEERKRYSVCVLIERTEDGGYTLAPKFRKMLDNSEFKDMVTLLLMFGEERYQENYSHTYKDTCFQLYQKYTYEDVCRLLGWKRNFNAQNIGGYFYDAYTKTLPVFINYDKDEDAIAYEDRFISENMLIALSKHPRKVTSSDAMHIYKRSPEDKDNRIFLFVRKNKDDNEAKEFYFLGEIFAEGEPQPIHMESTNDDAFEILYRLDVPVRSDIYDYIVRD